MIVPTAKCLEQHAFAGGLTLALAHDYRILKDAPGKGMLFHVRTWYFSD